MIVKVKTMILLMIVAVMTATSAHAARYGLLRIGEPASYGYGPRTTTATMASAKGPEAFFTPEESNKETGRHLLDEDFAILYRQLVGYGTYKDVAVSMSMSMSMPMSMSMAMAPALTVAAPPLIVAPIVDESFSATTTNAVQSSLSSSTTGGSSRLNAGLRGTLTAAGLALAVVVAAVMAYQYKKKKHQKRNAVRAASSKDGCSVSNVSSLTSTVV